MLEFYVPRLYVNCLNSIQDGAHEAGQAAHYGVYFLLACLVTRRGWLITANDANSDRFG